MYRVNINGAYRGRFKTTTEAMACVDKYARPFRYKWEILDSFNKIYAQG